MDMLRIVSLLVALAVAAPVRAQVPLLDGALPGAGERARAAYAGEFLIGNLARAFALSSTGGYGASWGAKSEEEARERALNSCGGAAKGCALYAVGLAVVGPGRAWAPAPPPPGPLLSGPGWAIATDARYLWFGPRAAKGVVVWGHGFNGNMSDSRGQQAPGFIRAFNNAGYDVLRFDRDPAYDHQRDEMGQALRGALRTLRGQGWARVVVGGQSRGGFNSLQTLDTAGLAEVVIALSEAAFGTSPGHQILMGQTDTYRLFSAAAAPATRLVYIQFADDPYTSDPDRMAEMVRDLLRPRVGRLLMIDRPEGFQGHGAGYSSAFAQRYAACILRFATAADPPAGC